MTRTIVTTWWFCCGWWTPACLIDTTLHNLHVTNRRVCDWHDRQLMAR